MKFEVMCIYSKLLTRRTFQTDHLCSLLRFLDLEMYIQDHLRITDDRYAYDGIKIP